MDPSLKNKTLGVHQQLPLPAADLLTIIVSSRFSTHSARLCRLRVRYCGTGLGISSEPSAQKFADRPVHPFPGAVAAPSSEVVVDGAPRREVVAGQEPLRTATPQDVEEDGVEDLAGTVDSGSTSLAGSRNIGLKTLPFSVGEIGGVAPFHAQERTSSTCPTRFFKQSLEEFFLETHKAIRAKRAGVKTPASD